MSPPAPADEQTPAELTARIVALETLTRFLADQIQIGQIVAAYGPAVDTLDGEAAADLWTRDGVYETAGQVFSGRDGIAGLVSFGPHPQLVAGGCGHVNSAPVIAISGDEATARSYSRVYRRSGGGWFIERLSANRWDLVREGTGWRVLRRVNRLLNGDPAARDLLHTSSQPADLAPSTNRTDPDT